MKLKFGLLARIITAIILAVVFGLFVPEWFVRIFATFSGLFGNFLNFVVPLIIIGFIAPGIAQLGSGSGKLLGFAAFFAYFSTIIAGILAYFAASTILPNFITANNSGEVGNPNDALATAFFTVEMPPIVDVMGALLFAFIVGVGMTVIKGDTLKRGFEELNAIVEKVISFVIIPLLPIHILGFS